MGGEKIRKGQVKMKGEIFCCGSLQGVSYVKFNLLCYCRDGTCIKTFHLIFSKHIVATSLV